MARTDKDHGAPGYHRPVNIPGSSSEPVDQPLTPRRAPSGILPNTNRKSPSSGPRPTTTTCIPTPGQPARLGPAGSGTPTNHARGGYRYLFGRNAPTIPGAQCQSHGSSTGITPPTHTPQVPRQNPWRWGTEVAPTRWREQQPHSYAGHWSHAPTQFRGSLGHTPTNGGRKSGDHHTRVPAPPRNPALAWSPAPRIGPTPNPQLGSPAPQYNAGHGGQPSSPSKPAPLLLGPLTTHAAKTTVCPSKPQRNNNKPSGSQRPMFAHLASRSGDRNPKPQHALPANLGNPGINPAAPRRGIWLEAFRPRAGKSTMLCNHNPIAMPAQPPQGGQ